MAETTGISWTDSTFNPWIGCTKVSPACDHCYAERLMDSRLGRVQWGTGQPRTRTSAAYWRQPLRWEREHEAFLQAHGRRRRVFCASLADVFDNEADPAWREDLFALIERTPNLDWLLLTKRIGNAAQMMFLARGGHLPLLPHVWLGATICNQEEADRDIPKLLDAPAAVRFLSIEPMLSAINIRRHFHRAVYDDSRGRSGTITYIDWVICGGESGPQARPMHPNWVRSLRDQCAAAVVPFHFKQWGEFLPATADEADPQLADVADARIFWSDGAKWDRFDGQRGGVDMVARVGAKAAGRLLDGIEHSEFPA